MPKKKEKREIIWEVPIKKIEIPKDVEEYGDKIEKKFIASKVVNIAFNSNQFIVRIPKDLELLFGLKRGKKHKFRFIVDSKKVNREDKVINGQFEVIK